MIQVFIVLAILCIVAVAMTGFVSMAVIVRSAIPGAEDAGAPFGMIARTTFILFLAAVGYLLAAQRGFPTAAVLGYTAIGAVFGTAVGLFANYLWKQRIASKADQQDS